MTGRTNVLYAVGMSPRYVPPIPTDELREIARNHPSVLVRRLLWEIRRLRIVEARARDVLAHLEHSGAAAHPSLQLVMGELRAVLSGRLPG